MEVLISENQYKNLFEAAMPGFRLDVLRSSGSFANMVKYCNKMLGQPIGIGSSRIVYQLDDETVLKLARDPKGIAQNKEEIKIGLESGLEFVPKIFNGTDERNGIWIISEFVLPATKGDFRKVFGIKFDDIYKFVYHLQLSKNPGFEGMHHTYCVNAIYDDYSWCVNGTRLLKEIESLFNNYNSLVHDLTSIENWGMCRRNGKTYMVILDSGCSREIYNAFYKFRI